MDTTNQFCPNEDYRDYGRVGAGNIGVHSLKEKRCIVLVPFQVGFDKFSSC